MVAEKIDGAALAQQRRDEIKKAIAPNNAPTLAIIRVGNDPASETYLRGTKVVEGVGIKRQIVALPDSTTLDELKAKITSLNNDPTVNGILLLLPLPVHLNTPEMRAEIIGTIDPMKDVEGITAANKEKFERGEPSAFVPCTAWGAMELVKSVEADPHEKKAVMIGMSEQVGRPMAQLLRRGGYDVTGFSADKNTQGVVELKKHRWQGRQEITEIISADKQKAMVREADVVVVAIGNPKRLIKSEWIKLGATVIDIGMHFDNEKNQCYGDVDYNAVSVVAGHITPVPGGVGPMTQTGLCQNVMKAVELQKERSASPPRLLQGGSAGTGKSM